MRHAAVAAVVPLTLSVALGAYLGFGPHASGSPTGECPCARALGGPGDAPVTRCKLADDPPAASELFVTGAAHVLGLNQTVWRSSLEVCNFGPARAEVDLELLVRGQANPEPESISFNLAAGVCARYPDVVYTLFGLEDAAGAIRIRSSREGLHALACTANDTDDGTYGSGLPARTATDGVEEGGRAVLIHLSESMDDAAGFRTNLDLLNLTGEETTVEIALHAASDALLGTFTTTLLPWEYDQLTRVFQQVTTRAVSDGYAVVRTLTPGGAVLAGASLVDNRSGDVVAIPAARLEPMGVWQEAENLGPVLNSRDNDWYPVVARDGSFMVFVSDRPGGHGSSDIYISRRVAGVWQEPENMGPNVNTIGAESAPFLGLDDRTLYFASFAFGGHGSMDIWWCPLDENGVAGERVNLGAPVNGPYLDCCPVLTADGNTLYLCSDRPGSRGPLDVWVSHRVGGVWQEPTNLGAVVNTISTDCPRWLSDDGDTLIISSTRRDGNGNADLWSVRRVGGEWAPPENLGFPVNSDAAEWGPGFLDNNGEIAGVIMFGSGRSGGEGGWDLWSAAHR